MKRFRSLFGLETPGKLLEAGLIAASLIIPFGIQINHLGLYGDDWSIALSKELVSNTSFLERLIQKILINLAGVHPEIYHLATLCLLFILGFILQKVLIQVGMDRVSAITSVVLFELYPGFLQPISGLELIGILVGLIFVVISVHYYLKWQNQTDPGIRFLVFGIIFSFFGMIISPYSAALISFTFLLIIIKKFNTNKRIEIYILGILLLLSGILFFIRFSYENMSLSSNLILRSIRVWLDSFVISWRQILSIPSNGRETLIYFLMMILAAFFLFRIYSTIGKEEDNKLEKQDNQNNLVDFTITVCCILAGFGYILLLTIAGFKLEINYPNDLGLIAIGALASIVVVIVVKLVFLPKYQLAILIVLIVLAGGAKYTIINRYADENSRVEDMLAQLSVRGDFVQQGTVLISEQLPFDFTSQKSIDALLNYQFGVKQENRAITYLSADHPELREFLRNSSINTTELRIDDYPIIIEKNNMLGFWDKPGGCVLLLDKRSEKANLPQELKYLSSISKPELFIVTNLSDVKQLDRFRNKIENPWCFYYQLASRQVAEGNWQAVLDTYTEAEKQGFTPQSLSDYLPLLNASLSEKLFQSSIEISQEFVSQPEQKDIICNYWNQYESDSKYLKEVISEVEKGKNVLGCP
jgi:hypothetical protein